VATITQHTPLLETEHVALDQALGRVLAADLIADENMPPFPTTSVDGYAVIASDTSSRRQIISEITAGRADELVVRPGTAARIMTGAPIPSGADAVVMVEQTREGDGYVELLVQPKQGDFIHPVG